MPDQHPVGVSGPPPADPLAILIEVLQTAQRLSPLEQVHAIPDLMKRANSLLAAARADAMIEITRDRHTGMSQADLARELDVSPAAVNNAIRDRRKALRSPGSTPPLTRHGPDDPRKDAVHSTEGRGHLEGTASAPPRTSQKDNIRSWPAT